jgi:hypothetical protein
MKLTDGLFSDTFRRVGAEYPDLEKEVQIIDIGTARVAVQPERYDVIVTLNLYGDIISDVTAELTGSVGLAGSANIGERISMFEAIHDGAAGVVRRGLLRVSISISPLLDDTGALAGFSKTSRDISPRKRAERSAQRLRRELERRVDARTRELREANKELRRAMQRERALQREILPFDTQVWPHAVRDSQGRTGLVLESSVPVSMLADSTDQEFLKGWIVCAILAVGKYSEIPGVRVDHVCFTDGTGAAGGGWFYDADHVFIMELYRSLVGGQVGAGEAYAALVSNWSHVVPES